MPPYFRDEDIPEPMCEGSYRDLNWEGKWDDPTRPKEITCPVCGVTLKPDFEEYEIGPRHHRQASRLALEDGRANLFSGNYGEGVNDQDYAAGSPLAGGLRLIRAR
jgi:hypothetical protein